MSVRDCLNGPFAEITVGSGQDAEVFNLPKVLLCESSTYFKAALNNGFSESLSQKITLDDENPEIFRTYAAWLYEHEINQDGLPNLDEDFKYHLVKLYIFADKRGIVLLSNDAITMFSSYVACYTPILGTYTKEIFFLLPPESALYNLILDQHVLRLRGDEVTDQDMSGFKEYPQHVLFELLKRNWLYPEDFKEANDIFQSVCHYHRHSPGLPETRGCERRIEHRRGVYSETEFIFFGYVDQKAWKWDFDWRSASETTE